ncbi:MAG: AAA family ATPase [Candidatus Freyarchaeota archaeon]|nr:AAA family ATPase [Candidatus Jordarchaeia archaeon]
MARRSSSSSGFMAELKERIISEARVLESPGERTPTGIRGFDELVRGGLFRGATYLLSGVSGAGKSIFCLEFLYRGAAEYGEPGLYVSLEEHLDSILRNARNFRWDMKSLIDRQMLVLLDLSAVAVGERALSLNPDMFALDGLYTTIETAVKEGGIKRVVLDPISVLFLQYGNVGVVRRELNVISGMLKRHGCTSIFVTETEHGKPSITRFGVEEFMADGVFILYWEPEGEKRSRYIEIYKMRGSSHYEGKKRFSVTDNGIVILY